MGEATKDNITLIWNQSLIDDPFGEEGEIEEEAEMEEELAGRKKKNAFFETTIHLRESDKFMEEILIRMNQLKSNIDLLKTSKIPDHDVSIQTVK